MEALAGTFSPYPDRRRRAEQLRDRHPHAAEVLTLYLALLDVQEPAFAAACARPPAAGALAAHVAAGVLPAVVEATAAAGPAPLAEAAVARFGGAGLEALVAGWLGDGEQSPVDRYLARAAATPVLEALPEEALRAACSGPADGRHCPRCGGQPQLSYFALSGEALVTGPRRLVCARCLGSWGHPRMVCAGCGESTGGRLPVYGESERLPHLRVDGCETCRRYLVAVDLRRDGAAVPVVDELAAMPLGLYAEERGLRKVVPNLMGM